MQMRAHFNKENRRNKQRDGMQVPTMATTNGAHELWHSWYSGCSQHWRTQVCSHLLDFFIKHLVIVKWTDNKTKI